MVDDDVRLVHGSQSVPAVSTVFGDVGVAQAEAKVAQDDIVGVNREGIVGDTDAHSRGTLSGDGHIALTQIEG